MHIVIVRARDQAREKLREMVISGSFRPGERLDEVSLSRRLGASRTPIREALIGLEEEGFVSSRPNHGFAIVTLDERAIREIYQIIAALEGSAVEAGGDALIASATTITAINERMREELRPARRYALDREFHRALTDPCDNTRLLRLLETYRKQAQRIDGAHKRGLADPKGSCESHAAIAAAITRGDLLGAGAMIRARWKVGQGVVLKWLSENS